LKDETPLYDLLISTPPFEHKVKFIKKAFDSGKPFVFLMPLMTMTLKCLRKYFSTHSLTINIPSKEPKFLLDGNVVDPPSMVAFFFGNMGQNIDNEIVVIYLQDDEYEFMDDEDPAEDARKQDLMADEMFEALEEPVLEWDGESWNAEDDPEEDTRKQAIMHERMFEEMESWRIADGEKKE